MDPLLIAGAVAALALLRKGAPAKSTSTSAPSLPALSTSQGLAKVSRVVALAPAAPAVPKAPPAMPVAQPAGVQAVIADVLANEQAANLKSAVPDAKKYVQTGLDVLSKLKNLAAGGAAAAVAVVGAIYAILSSIDEAMKKGRALGEGFQLISAHPIYQLADRERQFFEHLNNFVDPSTGRPEPLLTRWNPETGGYDQVKYNFTSHVTQDPIMQGGAFLATSSQVGDVDAPRYFIRITTDSTGRVVPREEKIALARYLRHYAYAFVKASGGWAQGLNDAMNDRFRAVVPPIDDLQTTYTHSVPSTYKPAWLAQNNAWLFPSYIDEIVLSPGNDGERMDTQAYAAIVQAARLRALTTVLSRLRLDAKIYFPWNITWYTDRVLKGLQQAVGTEIPGAYVVSSNAENYGLIFVPDGPFLGPDAGLRLSVLAFKEGRASDGVSMRSERRADYEKALQLYPNNKMMLDALYAAIK